MRPQDFKRWRKSLGLSQKEAAEALGLKRRVVQYYEKGERDGEKVKIAKTVRLACAALAGGIADYRGPDKQELAAAAKLNGEAKPAAKPAKRKAAAKKAAGATPAGKAPATRKAPGSKTPANKTPANKTLAKRAAKPKSAAKPKAKKPAAKTAPKRRKAATAAA